MIRVIKRYESRKLYDTEEKRYVTLEQVAVLIREGAEIKVSAARSEAGWTFSVESPGPAIDERDRQRIFEPWQRGWGERRSRGVGLGLAIVRQVVERHGGQVGVTSPEPSANRFFFTLPA